MKREKEIGTIFLIGLFLINVIFFTLVISTLFLALRIPVNPSSLILGVLGSAIFTFVVTGKSKKATLLVAFVGISFLIASIAVSQHTIDWSWDGNTYHKSMIGLLKNGWNPLYESFYDFADSHFDFLEGATATWFDAYPKATELWAANLYTITGNIESGKCCSLLSIIALFCICYDYLKQTQLLTGWQNALCSFFCVVNPVVVIQSSTYYNDGFLWHIFLLCFISLFYLTFFDNKHYQKLSCYLTLVSISIGLNVKFSALIYFALLCLPLFIYWIVEQIKDHGFNGETVKLIRSRFILLAGAVIFGICVLGSTSYIPNIIRYHNPVYTMIGEGSTEIITSQLPMAYADKSHAIRFIGSLFSRTSNSKGAQQFEWKIPFLFDGGELGAAQGVDTRIAGWGILFSGIFLLSLGIVFLAFVKYKKSFPKLFHILSILSLVLVGAIILVPGLCWARYNLALFLFPTVALIYLFYLSNSDKKTSQAVLFTAGILTALLTINMVPGIRQSIAVSDYSKQTYKELEDFRDFTEEHRVTIGYGNSWQFWGRFFSLTDFGITNYSYGTVDSTNCTGSLFSGYGLYYDIQHEPFPDFLDSVKENSENLLVLIAVKDEASSALSENIITKMQNLGLKFDLKERYRHSYLAIIDSGNIIYEAAQEDAIAYEGIVSGRQIAMFSAGYLVGNSASIKIDNIEFAKNSRGLNIVLFDKESGEVIDSICVDSCLDDNKIRR